VCGQRPRIVWITSQPGVASSLSTGRLRGPGKEEATKRSSRRRIVSGLVACLLVVGMSLSGGYPATAGSAAGGTTLWDTRYREGSGDESATSVSPSPDGSKVFVTGSSQDVGSPGDYATIAYDAATGDSLWVRRYDGPGDGADSAESVAVSPDGSAVFVTGSSAGAASSFDYATIAYDTATGATMWVRRYNGPLNSYDAATSVAAGPDGSTVFVTGFSLGLTSYDYATIAYDAATGAVRWVKRYNGPANSADVAHAVAPARDGSTIFVTGFGTTSTSSTDYATIAYDAATGAERWARRYDGPRDGKDVAFSVASGPGGSTVFVTGSSQGAGTDDDYATIAYDVATGATLWIGRYNGPGGGRDSAASVAASLDGSAVFATGTSEGATGSPDYATIAYDASTGTVKWARRYDGPADGPDSATAISPGPDGSGVFVTGFSRGTGAYDYATLAYDQATGAVRWVERNDGPGGDDDKAASVAVAPDGSKVLVTGTSQGATGNADYDTIAYGA
jgi:WD40 repeat protein